MQIFFTAFITIFLAELGDKTQIATLLFASNKETSKWVVFFGAALALTLTSAIAVLLGGTISEYVSEKTLKLVGGMGFIVVGVWTLLAK
jgi:putative Ca2+/H+ antiporter (TMEM165/GDT1 family)